YSGSTLRLSGGTTGTGSTVFKGTSGGAVVLDGPLAHTGEALVDQNGTLVLNSAGKLNGTLTVNGTLRANAPVGVRGLVNTGTIDLSGALCVDYDQVSPLSQLRSQ